jgi:poly-gamma-glutamate synthesis protein (capsule biosynthesis protein)
VEHQLKPYPEQRRIARQWIDAGADIIVGHHTHTLQSIETYHGKPIYYSIGNFIFDQSKPINTRGCMVRIRIAPTSAEVETIPYTINRCRPEL